MNDLAKNAICSRRGFLRYATLSGLLLGATKLVVLNGRGGGSPDLLCRRQFACGTCSQLEDCLLQPAQIERQHRQFDRNSTLT